MHRRPDPAPRSLTVLETRTSLCSAPAATRVAMWTTFNFTSTNGVPPMALSPCGRADWREAGRVKHEADAPYTFKHLLDLRCQLSAGLLHTHEGPCASPPHA
jgi:hypothetical protein